MSEPAETAATVVAPVSTPDAAEPAPVNHRADAAQAFMSTWLPMLGVSATAFSQADAVALLAAIDAGAAAGS